MSFNISKKKNYKGDFRVDEIKEIIKNGLQLDKSLECGIECYFLKNGDFWSF